MTLYELSDQYRQFIESIEAGEIPEEAIADTLDAMEGDINEKIDNTVSAYKSFIAEAEAIEAEEKILAKRKGAKKAYAERMKNYLAAMLPTIGIAEWESARHKLSFRKSTKLVIADEMAFTAWAMGSHDEYLSYSLPKINKNAVKTAMGEKMHIDGCEIVENLNIQIK